MLEGMLEGEKVRGRGYLEERVLEESVRWKDIRGG